MNARETQPAFPPATPTHASGVGLTVREWFAGQALAGVLGRYSFIGRDDAASIAKKMYEIADAMIDASDDPDASE